MGIVWTYFKMARGRSCLSLAFNSNPKINPRDNPEINQETNGYYDDNDIEELNLSDPEYEDEYIPLDASVTILDKPHINTRRGILQLISTDGKQDQLLQK